MHNTSGIRDMLEIMRLGGADLSIPCTRDDLLEAIFRQRTLNFAPGSRYLYSNSNFLLLGLIVERLGPGSAGFPRRAHLHPARHEPDLHGREHQCGGARACHRLPAREWRVDPRRARISRWAGRAGSCPPSRISPVGAQRRNRRVGGEALQKGLDDAGAIHQRTPQQLCARPAVRQYRGIRAVDHGGLWPGYKTEFLRAPTLRLAVICIANNGAADPYHVAHDMLDAAIEGRPGVHPVPPLPLPDHLQRFTGRWLDRDRATTLELSLSADGVPMGNANGVPFRLKASEDGRLVASRSVADFSAALSADGERLEAELDAGVTATYHRLTAPASLPEGLEGVYGNVELAATWTIAAAEAGLVVRVAGPLIADRSWEVEPIEGDVIRIYQPGTLFRSWVDVRVLRDGGGKVVGLHVNGGRARELQLARVE